MNDINQVFLVGRLTRDSESKYTANGTALCRFSIAVGRGVKKGEKWETETGFFDCTIWGKTVETMGKYLLKGKQVAVSGELRQERWEKDGQKQSKIGIVVSSVQLVGGLRSEDTSPRVDTESRRGGFDDDEIPF